MKTVDAIRTALEYADSWLTFQHDYIPYVGTQVAVRVDGKLLLNEAYGLADIQAGTRLTVDHLFRIASHSKTFTGVACLQLVEQGKLRLDDRLADHIPELIGSGIADVTVREALSHSGGIIRDGDNADWWELAKPFPDRQELIRVARDLGRVLPRNEEFKYSNIGFSLLGRVIEHASGQSYREYVTTEIVERLGLKNVGPDLDMERIDDYAIGYSSRVHGGQRIAIEHIDTYEESAATGFYATAADLTAYFQAHLPGDTRLLSDDSRRLMQQRVSETDDGNAYGLGIIIDRFHGREYIGHSGGYPGHITVSKVDRERKLSISVLTNANDGPATALSKGILGLIDLALNEDAKTKPGKGKELTPFEGRFATLWGITDIVALGGRLYALNPTLDDPASMATELERMSDHELKRVGGSKFGARGETLTFEFTRKGNVRKVTGGHTMVPVEKFTLPEIVRRPERAS